MSSRIIYSFFILIFLTSCGVKSDPQPPAGTGLPSYIQEFTAEKNEMPGVKEKDIKKTKKKKEKEKALLGK